MKDLEIKNILITLSQGEAEVVYYACLGLARNDICIRTGRPKSTIDGNFNKVYKKFKIKGRKGKVDRLTILVEDVVFHYIHGQGSLDIWHEIKLLIRREIREEEASLKQVAQDTDTDEIEDKPTQEVVVAKDEKHEEKPKRKVELKTALEIALGTFSKPEEVETELKKKDTKIKDLDENIKDNEPEKTETLSKPLNEEELEELGDFREGIDKWHDEELEARGETKGDPPDEPPDEHPIIIPEAPAKVEKVIDDEQEEESDNEDSDDSFEYIPPDPDPIKIQPADPEPEPEPEDDPPPEIHRFRILLFPFWLLGRFAMYLEDHPRVLFGLVVLGSCCYISNLTGLIPDFTVDDIRSAIQGSSSSEVIVLTPTASSPVKIARRVTASEYIAENRLKATVSESMTYLDNHFQFYFQVSNIGDDDLILSLQPKQFLLYDNMGNNYYAFPDNTVEERDIFTLKPKEFKMYVFKENRPIRFFGPRDPGATKYFFKVESFYTLPDVIWTYYVE